MSVWRSERISVSIFRSTCFIILIKLTVINSVSMKAFVFMWFGVIRLLLWDSTLEKECTCRAAGTSWTVCLCLCHWWTSWFPLRQRVEIGS